MESKSFEDLNWASWHEPCEKAFGGPLQILRHAGSFWKCISGFGRVKVIFPLSFFSPPRGGGSDETWPWVICVETKTGLLLFHKGSWKKKKQCWGFYDRKWKSRIVTHWPSRCELPWSWVLRVGRALERGRLAASPIHPELLLLFYSETSLTLGKETAGAVKQAKHVDVTSEGSSFLVPWFNSSEH